MAIMNTASFVDWSPSTDMRLNDHSTACSSQPCMRSGSSDMSVVMTTIMVASLGFIIPDPFAIAPSRTVLPAISISTASSFG